MAKLRDLVFDCHHPASLARFWATTLDDYQIAPYDDAELERLAALGVFDIEDDPTVLLQPLGPGPKIWFQLVPEPKTVKNRIHVDVSASDVDAEIERLKKSGARLLSDHRPAGLVVMQDPENNEFCLMPERA